MESSLTSRAIGAGKSACAALLPAACALTLYSGCALVLVMGCAHMEAPPGGPTDTKRPYVAAVLPAPDAVNAPRDLDARIKFSEWVAPDAERGKVYLVPPLTRKLRTKLAGDELAVTSAGRLDTNTTYILGVLGSVKDINGQPLENPMQLAFSTGPTLDSGRLAGTVVPFQNRPAAGAFAALYPRGQELRARFQHLTHRNDSVVVPSAQPDPRKEKPAYIAPADSLGRYSFKRLRPGRYGLVGFQDINGDLNPNVGAEGLGIGPSVDIAAAQGEDQTLALAPYDTVPLRLAEARWVGERMQGGKTQGTVRLKFNKPPHPIELLRREAYAVKKVKGAALTVFEVCLNPISGDVELAVGGLDPDSLYEASCPSLRDPFGNLADTARNRATFKADTSVRDTAKAELVLLGPRKVSGEVTRLPLERIVPGRGALVYHPRLLTDSALAWLRSHLVVKADTIPVAWTLSKTSHHEFWLQFAWNLPLKGQRLVLGFLPDSVTVNTAPGQAPAPKTGAATPPAQTAPVAAPPKPGTPAAPAAPGAPKPATPAETPANLSPKNAGATKDSIPAKPTAPQPVTFATFTVAEAAKFGSVKFRQDRSAFGSRLVLRGIGAPWEFTRLTPSAEEVVVDSLPDGLYAVDYFRDMNGDGVWQSGSLAPWALQEPYVHWADSVEVKAGGVNRGDGRRPGATGSARAGVSADSSKTVGSSVGTERVLAWPPRW